MNNEVYEALMLLEKERGISIDFMMDKINKAIVTACKNNYSGNDDVIINMDKKTGKFEVFLRKTVVEDVTDSGREISIADARKIDINSEIGEKVAVELDTKEFGRIAAQTARNIIRQGIRDGEKNQVIEEFKKHYQDLITAVVERIDPRTGNLTLKISKSEAVLPKAEQIPGEKFVEGEHIKVFVLNVKETEKGPKAIISRTHPNFVKRLIENEVPEIHDGIIEIKSVSRDAGARTKIAVFSADKNIDAVGSCIGQKGSRILTIINELGGEKIDVINYSEDKKEFISAALAPAKVLSVEESPDDPQAYEVTVPDGQLSLAIGNKGQNVRLAAKLTDCKIDIKPESGFFTGSTEKF